MKDKISKAIKRIQVAYHIAERGGEEIVVCFSGGKDSQVTLHLVQRAGVPYRAVYNVTTIDQPLNVNFIRKKYPIVEFVHPELNFCQLIEKKKMLPSIWKRFLLCVLEGVLRRSCQGDGGEARGKLRAPQTSRCYRGGRTKTKSFYSLN